MRRIDNIVLHCTAGPQTQSVQTILAFWKNSLGWKNPGYHYLIKPDGEAVELLPIERIANGVSGYNAHSIHISYIGGQGGVDNRTCEQKQTMIRLIKELQCKFPAAAVVGHRDLSPDINGDGIIQSNEWTKLCPSFSVANWVRNVGLLLILCLLFASCGSKKSLSRNESRQEIETVSTIRMETQRETSTEIYGDTLTGEIPIPELTEKPLEIPVESNGIQLNLKLQKGKMSYTVVAKPVGNITERATGKTAGSNETNEFSNSSEEEESSRKAKGLPWWLLLPGILTGIYFLWKYTRVSTWIKIVIQKLLK